MDDKVFKTNLLSIELISYAEIDLYGISIQTQNHSKTWINQ